MFWPTLIAHLSVSLLFCGLLLRGVRRYSLRVEEVIRRLDEERIEIDASLSAITDRAIEKFHESIRRRAAVQPTVSFLDDPVDEAEGSGGRPALPAR